MTTSTNTSTRAAGWFSPLTDPHTWSSTAYLMLTLPLGIMWFTFTVTSISAGVGLLIVWVGVVILAGAMLAWRFGGDIERRLVSQMLGVVIPEQPRGPASTGVLATLRSTATDPATWRSMMYLVLLLPLGIIWFTVSVTAWSIPGGMAASPFFYDEIPGGIDIFWSGNPMFTIDTLPEALATSLVGILLLPVAARVVVGAGRIHASIATALLGPSRTELEERAEDREQARDRSVSVGEADRQRIERDLHDGAQQRLVALAMELGRAKEKLDTDPAGARALVEDAHTNAKLALVELRDLARGIHPAVLTDRGLNAALSALAGRSPIPSGIACDIEGRLPASVESTAYFVVAEALTNAGKHSNATSASVVGLVEGDVLVVEVADDGTGGADVSGMGLRGLADRVAAVNGTLTVTSPIGGPTVVRAEIPCAS